MADLFASEPDSATPEAAQPLAEHLRPRRLEDVVGQEHLRSEEHTSELQSLMRISYAVFCLKKKTIHTTNQWKSTLLKLYACSRHHAALPSTNSMTYVFG